MRAFAPLPACWASVATATADPAPRYEIVDGHVHFLNFVQETSGMDAFLKAMDDTGVTESVVLGLPLVKKWEDGDAKRPTYYLDNDSPRYWYNATDFLVARAVLDLPIESATRMHANTRMTWAHAGISRRIVIPNHTDILRRMLGQYPNLTADLSWVIFEQEIASGGVLDRRWVSLIKEYPAVL